MFIHRWPATFFIILNLALLASSAALGPIVAAAEDQRQPIPLTFLFPELTVPTNVDADSIDVRFNPKEFGIDKPNPWNVDKPLSFTAGKPFSLAMDLQFDTSATQQSVQPWLDAVRGLVGVETTKPHPPLCLVVWGEGPTFGCVIESMDVRYTLFLADGTPVRATAHVVFTEFKRATEPGRNDPRH